MTGAAGFIGSHLVERLVGLGARVRAFVRYDSRRDVGLLRFTSVLRDIEVVAGDLRDPDAVRAAAADCATIFHLGALIAIPYSYVHPREVVETNVLGTLNVLEAVRAARCERLIHTSTSEVYGTALRVPIDEQHPLQGQSPYSASKIGADKLVESFARSFGTPALTVRPFNTFGPRQSARAVIPTIISQALAGKPVKLGSRHPTRDFTFVGDTVAGFVAAGEAPETALREEINLGTGTEISIGDLATRIGRLLGRPIEVVTDEQRVRPAPSEVERLRADPSKAKRLLGWEARVPLDAGLERTIEWMRDHLDLYDGDLYQV